MKNLSYFLRSTGWGLAVLTVMHASFLIKRLPPKLYVSLDMTALVKTGKHFEYLGQVHDGRDNQVKPGYNLLLSLAINQTNSKEQYILESDLISNKTPDWQGENPVIVNHIKKLIASYKNAKLSLKNVIHIGDRNLSVSVATWRLS